MLCSSDGLQKIRCMDGSVRCTRYFIQIILITSLWNPNIDLGKKIFDMLPKNDLTPKR